MKGVEAVRVFPTPHCRNAKCVTAAESVGAQYVLNLDGAHDGDKPGEGGAKRRFLPSDGGDFQH